MDAGVETNNDSFAEYIFVSNLCLLPLNILRTQVLLMILLSRHLRNIIFVEPNKNVINERDSVLLSVGGENFLQSTLAKINLF